MAVVNFGLAPRTADVGAEVVGTLADDAAATLGLLPNVAGESATLVRDRAGEPTAFADMEEVLGAARVIGVERVGCTPDTVEAVLLAVGAILGLADVGLDPGVPLRLLTTLHAAGRCCFGVLEGIGTRGLLPRTDAVVLPLRVTEAVDPLRVTTDAFTTRVGLGDSHSAVTDDSRVLVGLFEALPGTLIVEGVRVETGVETLAVGDGAPRLLTGRLDLVGVFACDAAAAGAGPFSLARRFSSALRARYTALFSCTRPQYVERAWGVVS